MAEKGGGTDDPVVARPPTSVLEARRLLRKSVQKSGIQVSGGLGCDKAIALDDLFVNLTLLTSEELKELFADRDHFSSSGQRATASAVTSDANREPLGIEPGDLFKAFEWPRAAPCGAGPTPLDEELNNVLVLGGAGSGKTTVFLKMLVYLWCMERIWPDQFDLVVSVKLHDPRVQAADSLKHLLSVKLNSLDLDENEVSEATRYFRMKPSRLCLVLDGLDECSLDSCSPYMRDLLLRENNEYMHVIVTSRPCSDAHKLSLSGQYQQQIEVLGFSPENVRKYVHKVVGGRERAEALLRALKDNTAVGALMSIPMFAALTCELFVSGKGLAKCSTALYASLLLRVVERRGGGIYKSFDEANPQHVQALVELGRFAFRMLASKKVVFDESDLKQSRVGDEARRLGLLQSCKDDTSTNERQYRFAHLSLQEFLAAWFMERCVVTDARHCAGLVERVGVVTGHMTMFWHHLVAVLPSETAHALLEHLWSAMCRSEPSRRSTPGERDGDGGRSLAEDMLSNPSVLFSDVEVADVHDGLCAVLSLPQMEKLADALLEKWYGVGVGHQRARTAMPRGRDLTDALYLRTLLSLWTEKECVPTGTHLFQALLRIDAEAARSCESFLHPGGVLGGTPSRHDAAPVVAVVQSVELAEHGRRGLQLLKAYEEHATYRGVSCDGRCVRGDGRLCLLGQCMCAALAYLKVAGHSGYTLSVPECKTIGFVMCHHHSCLRLGSAVGLSYCAMGDAGFGYVAAGLRCCANVRELDLYGNDICNARPLSALISALSAGLEKVQVGCNRLDAAGFAAVCSALCECTNAQELGVSGLASDVVALAAVCEVLESCSLLRVLGMWELRFEVDDSVHGRFLAAVRAHSTLRTIRADRLGFGQYVISDHDRLDLV